MQCRKLPGTHALHGIADQISKGGTSHLLTRYETLEPIKRATSHCFAQWFKYSDHDC